MKFSNVATFELNLENNWKIIEDVDNCGKESGWMNEIRDGAIEAHFPGNIVDSIENFTRGVVWYYNRFDALKALDPQCQYYLKAGYTEWIAEYWLNGQFVGRFIGTRQNYEFEITEYLRQKDNLLAIRIVSPNTDGIDGYHFGGVLINEDVGYTADNLVNHATNFQGVYGGIQYPMYVEARPRVRTGRTVIKSDWQTGGIDISTELINNAGEAKDVILTLNILSHTGATVWSESKQIVAEEGVNAVSFDGAVAEHKLWDVESPYLYTALLTVAVDGAPVHSAPTRFGFRDFRVKDGFFFLNGRRVFVRCGHTSIGSYKWMNKPWDKQCLRDELIRTKAMGQNATRYLSNCTWPELLDLCDEIGLMVYQEHAASWHMSDENPYFEQQFDDHVRAVLRRDINHPSFTIFGLINESHSERERTCAQNELKLLREEDDSRLVMYGSGRWDDRFNVGSVSNPGSWEWECVWGIEDPNPIRTDKPGMCRYGWPELTQYGGEWGIREDELTCWSPYQGDVHIYPRIPMTERSIDIIRNHCKDMKPTFLSEGSHISMANPIKIVRQMEQAGYGDDKNCEWMERVRAEWFERDFYKYGLDDLYGVPEDVVYDSYLVNAKQRSFFFDCVRSNPQYCGMSFTQIIEHSGAGMIEWDRQMYKPYMQDCVSQSFAPLHWCVFVNPTHVYRGKPFTVEAVLASEDVLGPGEYPVTAKIVSKEYGKVWEYHTVLTIPEVPECGYNPFSFFVFKEEVTIDLPEGKYDLTVYMDKGGAPTGGRKEIFLTEHKPLSGVKAAMTGLSQNLRSWLADNGVEEDAASKLILVGEMPDEDAAWDELYDKVRAGASAVMLLPETLLKNVENPFDYGVYVPERLPFENKGKLTFADNWHYHTFGAVKVHPFTKDLQKGLMDDEYFMLATPQMVLYDQDVPDEIAALTFAVPYYTHTGEGTTGYLFGTALSTYKLGEGRLVLNCFKLHDQYGDSPAHQNLGKNPAADRLLLNIISSEVSAVK